MSFTRLSSLLRPTTPAVKQCFNKRFISLNTKQSHFLRRMEPPQPKDANFSTNPYNEAMSKFKSQAKLVGKITAYTAISVTTAVAFIWQSSHWYIEYMMHATPSELGYQGRNLLHGAFIRESVAPDYEVAALYVREALRIALEEKQLPENSQTVIDLRLRLARDEAHCGNVLDAITEYTRAWKLMLDNNKQEISTVLMETAKHIGDLYLHIGDLEKSEEFLVWALHYQQDDVSLLKSKITLTLASLYAMQRNFSLALPLLSQTLQSLPAEEVCLKAIVQNQLAETMFAQGKTEESMGWAQAALDSCLQDIKSQDCLECGGVASNNLAILLELRGEFDNALEYYQQAIKYSLSVHDSASHDKYVLNAERLKEKLLDKEE